MFAKGNETESKSTLTATNSGVSANLKEEVMSPVTAPNKDIKESLFVNNIQKDAVKKSNVVVPASADPKQESKVKSLVDQKVVSVADIKK